MIRSLVLAALSLALAACSPPQAAKEAPAAPPAADAVVSARGEGEIVVLQPEYAAVTIRHAPIPEYGMGAMTMEFTADSADVLKGLKVGDKVTFELKGPTEIATIAAAPPSP